MTSKNRKITILLGLALMMLFCSAKTQPALAYATALSVQGGGDVAQGTFKVSIIAENIPSDNKMYGWELVLNWTAGVINCTAETINYGIWVSYLGPWIPYPIDNAKGEYHQSLTGRSPATPVSGTYWLVNVTFTTVKGPCNSTGLTLKAAPGYVYCLLNNLSEEIPHDYIQANIHVVPEFPSLYFVPPLLILSAFPLVIKKLIKKRR